MKTTPLPSVVHATCVTDGELRLEEQIDYQVRIQKELGLNLVSCGFCGSLQFQECEEDWYTCYACGETMDKCDMPDLFYTGMSYQPFEVIVEEVKL